MIVGFTGSKAGMTPQQVRSLKRLLSQLKPTRFHHGMCVGADEQAHMICAGMGAVRIVGHPPTKTDLMMQFDTREFVLIMAQQAYLTRNRAIVKLADQMIATPRQRNEQFRGSGTWATMRAARKASKPLHVIWPDGEVSLDMSAW